MTIKYLTENYEKKTTEIDLSEGSDNGIIRDEL